MNCREFFERLVAHGFVSEYRRNGVISLRCEIATRVNQTINDAWGTSCSYTFIRSYLACLGFMSEHGRGATGAMAKYVLCPQCPHTINITINRYRQDVLPYMSTTAFNSSRFCERVKQLADYTQRAHTEQIYGAAINSLDYPTKNTLVEQSVLNWVMHGYPPTR